MMNEHAYHLLALAISVSVVTVCVILHYETLRFLGRTVSIHVHKRIGVLVVMLSLLLAHVLEIMIFALGYMLMQKGAGLGHITGMDEGNFFDFVYFSSVVYTTVGFGDLLPVGAIRMLSAAEGLAGLALITWSASFTFLAMQRLWPHLLTQSGRNSED
ncbi:potassium channel family protein [Nitrosomonas sp.]|uniref:potassium channel family protein n=1 Tax=Nitrosomonas sp. TaxID=42353 RepID=UPI001D7F9D71|nr:potassium channel family protein [Nitrosomonas sp.]MBX3616603.1 two pore domain potassium channel family protein [Nitrosomonas sp.]